MTSMVVLRKHDNYRLKGNNYESGMIAASSGKLRSTVIYRGAWMWRHTNGEGIHSSSRDAINCACESDGVCVSVRDWKWDEGNNSHWIWKEWYWKEKEEWLRKKFSDFVCLAPCSFYSFLSFQLSSVFLFSLPPYSVFLLSTAYLCGCNSRRANACDQLLIDGGLGGFFLLQHSCFD